DQVSAPGAHRISAQQQVEERGDADQGEHTEQHLHVARAAARDLTGDVAHDLGGVESVGGARVGAHRGLFLCISRTKLTTSHTRCSERAKPYLGMMAPPWRT